MDEYEYYVIMSNKGPSLSILGSDILLTGKRIEPKRTLTYVFKDPITITTLTDHMMAPHSIISKKIYEVLEPMNINSIQLLPSRILDLDRNIHEPFWAIHIPLKIRCIDEELSDCKILGSIVTRIKKIVLDKKVLSEIPLNDRLVFRLKEHSTIKLYHKSVKDAIEAVNGKGIRFVNIEEWTRGSYFKK